MKTEKNKGGRPRTNATPITLRLAPELLAWVDDERAKIEPEPSRPEFIRQLIERNIGGISMSNAQFSIGDVVRLKSGGLSMTYDREAQTGYGVCKWFDEKNKLHTETFNHEMLVLWDDDPISFIKG